MLKGAPNHSQRRKVPDGDLAGAQGEGRRRNVTRRCVVVIPLIGVLVYLIARGGTMHDRATQRAMGQDQEIRDFGQQYTGPSSADQLATLADLRDRGVTADEFDREKAKVLVRGCWASTRRMGLPAE
jgi:hypothetical protein